MKINKKVIFGMVAGLFAVATVFNMSMLNDNGAGDVSLDAVAVMAQADGGSGDSAPCCTNGYKSWFNTSNNPAQREQSFKDCWCNAKEGYDPINCEC